MDKICICGSGTMGSGIAQVSAIAGFPTILLDTEEAAISKAKTRIANDLEMMATKGKIPKERIEKINRLIYFTSSISECKADIIIEAIIENPEAKSILFNKLSQINSPETILASNTSSLSISSLAKSIPYPERIAGIHFFNPSTIMRLVEIIEGEKTDSKVIDRLVQLSKQFGKIPVICKDSPGFIVNRVARPFYIESLRILEEGKSTCQQIDKVLEGAGFKMGPFKLMDLIGNDINYAVSCSVYEQLGKPARLTPSPIQKEKVESNQLGKKTGRGYYSYD
jgi:3-hydroxybutyryl-CoA dehydrogenase